MLALQCRGRRLWCVGGGRRARRCALGCRMRELGRACWRCLITCQATGLRRDYARLLARYPRQDAGPWARSLVVDSSGRRQHLARHLHRAALSGRFFVFGVLSWRPWLLLGACALRHCTRGCALVRRYQVLTLAGQHYLQLAPNVKSQYLANGS